MQQFLDIAGLVVKILVPALVALYFIVVGSRRAWQGIKEFWLYRKLIRYDREGGVSRFFERLANLPPETVPSVLSQLLLPVDSILYLEQMVKEYTQILPKKTLVGIHDTAKGKVNTRFYVDVLSACCDAETRRKLASMMAIRVTDISREKQYTFDAIAISARGNVLLAAEVGDLLDKPIVVFGDLAGVSFPERINAMTKKPQRYIIVDGLSASGEEILFVAKLIKDMGADARYVFTVIDRCFGAKDRVKNESPFPHPIDLSYIAEYDDKKCAQLLGNLS